MIIWLKSMEWICDCSQILAKLACGINKPNKQTVLPQASVASLFQTMPIAKV